MSVNVRLRNGMVRSGGSGGVSEGDVRGDWSDAIDIIGVVDLAGGHLLVHQAGTPAMTVVVDSGVGYIPNSSFDETDSDSIKFWEAVVAGTTLSRTLNISSNSSGQTRVDKICLKLDPGTSPDGNGTNVAELIVVEGTPGAGAPATPFYHLELANVTVANGASSIVDANITDLRVQSQIKNEFLPDTLDDKSITNLKQVSGLFDNGNSGTAKTINFANGDRQKLTITGNVTLTFSGAIAGQIMTLLLVENGTGGFSITLPTVKWPNGSPGSFTTTANAINVFTVMYDGTNYLATLMPGMA
jgi:hypothetical protein